MFSLREPRLCHPPKGILPAKVCLRSAGTGLRAVDSDTSNTLSQLDKNFPCQGLCESYDEDRYRAARKGHISFPFSIGVR